MKNQPLVPPANRLNKFISHFGMFIIVVVFWLMTLLLTLTLPESPLSLNNIGDAFGTLNTLFSGLAFAGMIRAIHLQKKELQLQREELKETRIQFTVTADAHKEMVALSKQKVIDEKIARLVAIRPEFSIGKFSKYAGYIIFKIKILQNSATICSVEFGDKEIIGTDVSTQEQVEPGASVSVKLIVSKESDYRMIYKDIRHDYFFTLEFNDKEGNLYRRHFELIDGQNIIHRSVIWNEIN